MAISRKNSRYKWFKGSDELDELDQAIIKYLKDFPGLNVMQVYQFIKPKKAFRGVNRQTIYYRINSLEHSGFITTKKARNERLCYAKEP